MPDRTPDREQPLDLVYAPPRYPGHEYAGEGVIVRVHVAGETVGWLTRQGEAVGFLPAKGTEPWGDLGTVRLWVQDVLRERARLSVPLDDTWEELLAGVQHDDPATGPLDGFQG